MQQRRNELLHGYLAIIGLAFVASRIPKIGYRLTGYVHASTLKWTGGRDAPMHWHDHPSNNDIAVYRRVTP